jgi:hypothetical protein
MKLGTAQPRAVLVRRVTEFEGLVRQHGTTGQASFFLKSRGRNIEAPQAQHDQDLTAVALVQRSIPTAWRRATIDRNEIDRFAFEPEDLVIVVGQDGLVANVARYLDGQRLLGVNPDGGRQGLLCLFHPGEAARALTLDGARGLPIQQRTMVEAELDDGQRLYGLNEVFLGHQSHQSARYRIRLGAREERHSSSGLIVATGTGATGWASSIHRATRSALGMPQPEEAGLAFFVREAWPSPTTQTELVEGRLGLDEVLEVVSELESGGAIFADGIERDRLEWRWGQRVRLRIAGRRLQLLSPRLPAQQALAGPEVQQGQARAGQRRRPPMQAARQASPAMPAQQTQATADEQILSKTEGVSPELLARLMELRLRGPG